MLKITEAEPNEARARIAASNAVGAATIAPAPSSRPSTVGRYQGIVRTGSRLVARSVAITASSRLPDGCCPSATLTSGSAARAPALAVAPAAALDQSVRHDRGRDLLDLENLA